MLVCNVNRIVPINNSYKVLIFCMCWCLPFLSFQSHDHNLYSEKQVGVGTLTSASFFTLQYILFNQSNQFEIFRSLYLKLFQIKSSINQWDIMVSKTSNPTQILSNPCKIQIHHTLSSLCQTCFIFRKWSQEEFNSSVSTLNLIFGQESISMVKFTWFC